MAMALNHTWTSNCRRNQCLAGAETTYHLQQAATRKYNGSLVHDTCYCSGHVFGQQYLTGKAGNRGQEIGFFFLRECM